MHCYSLACGVSPGIPKKPLSITADLVLWQCSTIYELDLQGLEFTCTVFCTKGTCYSS